MTIQLQPHFPLSYEDIKHAFPQNIFLRGLHYFQTGRVKTLLRTSSTVWMAHVLGQDDIYEVHLDWNPGREFRLSCHCPASETWGACKHQVAALLALGVEWKYDDSNQDSNHSHPSMASHLTQRLVDAFRELREASSAPSTSSTEDPLPGLVAFPNKETLKLRYLLYGMTRYQVANELGALTMELKAGVEREYVVKEIASFINHIGQAPYTFTSRFTYDPTQHRLDDKDLEIVELLKNYIAEYRFLNNEQLILKDKRYLLLTPAVTNKLLPLLAERATIMSYRLPFDSGGYDQHQMCQLKYRVVEPLPLSIKVTYKAPKQEEDRSYALDLNDLHHWHYLPDYGLLLKEGTFYPVPEKDQAKIKHLFKTVRHLHAQQGRRNTPLTLPLDPASLGPVMEEVIDQVDDLVDVEVDETVAEHIVREPVKTVIDIFESQQHEHIFVNVFHHYGKYIFKLYDDRPHRLENDALHPVTEDVIIIRDKEEEQKVMAILEEAPLTVTPDGLTIEPREDALYQFLFDVLPRLGELADIYLDKTIERTMREAELTAQLDIDLSLENDWLEINFQLEGLDEQSIAAIVQGLKEKKRYVRLDSGSFVPLNQGPLQVVAQLSDALDLELGQLLDGKVNVPLYRAWHIDQLLKVHRDKAQYSRAFRQLLAHLRQPEGQHFDLPTSLQTRLREYQEVGFGWFKALSRYGLGGILADEMGLGKTVQTIAYLASEWEEGKLTAPALIVAPTSLVYNWLYELERFAPELSVAVIDGTPSERAKRIAQSEKVNVWITSYPLLRQDHQLYAEHHFSVLILDEAQHIKNHQTKAYAAVLSIQATRRFALTGTPIENRLDELWAILQAVLPGFFPKRQLFVNLTPEKVRHIIQPFILRRLKQDVLTELPPKIENVQFSELTREQKALYLHYLEQTIATAQETLATEGLSKGRIKILAALTRLRQICCHPSLFVDHYAGSSGKLEQLVSLVKEAVRDGRRPVIFSQFTSMLALIQDALAKEGLADFYLDGQTKAHQRLKMVEAFNQGERDLFLISLKAGGTGLNLTGADTVILYDLWWNPAVDEQAIGRAHRLGQKKVVQVIRLLAQGTIEEKIYALQQKKKALIDDVLTHDEALLGALSEEDLKEILGLS